MSLKPIYLDYASSHPRISSVQMARDLYEQTSYANIGRGNYDLAESSMIAYGVSKKTVAAWIGCEPVEVLYTYSATYALNLLALALECNHIVGRGDTILLSLSEHHANIVPWQMLADRVGAQVKFVGIDEYYRIDLADLTKKLDDSVKVVSLQYASNVTGAWHPIDQVRSLIGSDRLFFVDATQAVLHGSIDMRSLGCDALVFSGHKIGADTGIGVLALTKTLQKSWQAPIGGGGAINVVTREGHEQAGIPEKWEPGTPHLTGAVTLTAALHRLSEIPASTKSQYHACIDRINTGFNSLADRIRVFHSHTDQALGIWSFLIPGKHSSDVADFFSERDICIRSGHHCCQPLHDSLFLTGTVRVSIGYDTTLDEIDTFFDILGDIL